MSELKHYKMGGNLTHIGVEVLPNKDGKIGELDVVISEILWVEKCEVNGRKIDCFVAKFKGNPFGRDMVLNTTNKKVLCSRFKTEYPQTIKNALVTLCAKDTRDPNGGGTIKGLRISPIVPKAKDEKGTVINKQELDVSSPNFDQIKEWLAKENNKLSSVVSKYEVTPAALEILKTIKSE